MKKIALQTLTYLFVSFVAKTQNGDSLIIWSLSNDTSATYVSPELKAKGERFGGKLNNISYTNGYQKINPPSGGWTSTIDTTTTAGVYIDFPFRFNLNQSFFSGGGTLIPYNIIVNGYTDAVNDSIKLSAYFYDSSLYYDSAFYYNLLSWDTTKIYNGTTYNAHLYYYKYISGHWYYFTQNNINPGIYDSSIVVYTTPYSTKAIIQKTGDYYIKSNSSINPDSINSSSSFQAWLNLPRKIVISDDRVVFARIYISSNNPNANLYLKEFSIGGDIIYLLPINFKSFTALKKNDKVELNWLIENERNINKYVVEKANAINVFEAIKTVVSNKSNSYTITDEAPNKTTNVYRIKAIAKDGKATYSSIVRVLYNDKNETVIIYPNPAKDVLNVQIKNNKAEKATIEIADLQGKAVQQKEQYLQVGSNSFSINISALAKGVYTLSIKCGSSQVVKFIKE